MFSFEWPLTHRSFLGSYMSLLIFWSYSQILFKSVTSEWIPSVICLLQDRFQILFIIGWTFVFFIPESLNKSWWRIPSSFSDFEDRRRVYLKSWSVLSKIHGSSFMPSSQIVSIDINYFHTHPKHFMSSFGSRFFGGHHFIIIHSSFHLLFSKS